MTIPYYYYLQQIDMFVKREPEPVREEEGDGNIDGNVTGYSVVSEHCNIETGM